MCMINTQLKTKYNLPNNNDYRYFLQDNAVPMMQQSYQGNFCAVNAKSAPTCTYACQCTAQNPIKCFAPRWGSIPGYGETSYPERPIRLGLM